MGNCSTKKAQSALRALDPAELKIIWDALEKQDFSTAFSSVCKLWLAYDTYTPESQQVLDKLVRQTIVV
jgi:hypothetical protein